MLPGVPLMGLQLHEAIFLSSSFIFLSFYKWEIRNLKYMVVVFFLYFSGEEPPESLFMKELKKRGMTPISLLEESNRSIFWDDEMKFKEEERGYSKRNAVTTDYEKGFYAESEPSTALNSGLKVGTFFCIKGSIPVESDTMLCIFVSS